MKHIKRGFPLLEQILTFLHSNDVKTEQVRPAPSTAV